MDKPILIFYFNKSESFSYEEFSDYMNRAKESISKNKEVLSYVLGGEGIETRVECINPKLIDGNEYKKIQEILDRNQKIVDDIVNNYEK